MISLLDACLQWQPFGDEQRGSKMFEEFKKFIMRGNVLDLAVGIIIGTAFGAIVSSLVNDVVMPPIGLLVGGIDFSQIKITLQAAQGETPEVAINIGVFINAVINFLIVAFVIFMLVRWFNSLMTLGKKQEAAPEAPKGPSEQEIMIEELRAIRKALEKK